MHFFPASILLPPVNGVDAYDFYVWCTEMTVSVTIYCATDEGRPSKYFDMMLLCVAVGWILHVREAGWF